jgi:hypothetical protein
MRIVLHRCTERDGIRYKKNEEKTKEDKRQEVDTQKRVSRVSMGMENIKGRRHKQAIYAKVSR